MQEPVFNYYGWMPGSLGGSPFTPAFYAKAEIKVQQDTCYLGHLLTYVQNGIMGELSNTKLRELGYKSVFMKASLKFFPAARHS